jgi:hypothetical protein
MNEAQAAEMIKLLKEILEELDWIRKAVESKSGA